MNQIISLFKGLLPGLAINIFIPNIHQTNSNSDKIDHKIKGTGDDVLDIFSVQE